MSNQSPSFNRSDQDWIKVENDYNLLNQHGDSPPLLTKSSSLHSNDLHRPFIEMDIEECDRGSRMFVTPDPDQLAFHSSVSISIKGTPRSASRLASPQIQNPDDECMIVDVVDCNPKSREKWLKSEGRNKNSPLIKIELERGRAKPEDLVKLQRKLIAQRNAAKLHKSGATSVFRTFTRPVDLERSQEVTFKPQQGGIELEESQDNIIDANTDVEPMILGEDDDHSWMNVTNDDDGTGELEKLNMLKLSFEARHGSKKLSELDAIKLLRINQQIELHNRRINAMNSNDILLSPSSSSEEDDDDNTERILRKTFYSEAAEDMRKTIKNKQGTEATKKPAKAPRRKAAKNAREVEDRRREKERQKQQKKRARAANSKGGPGKGKGSKNLNSNAKSKGKKAKSYMKEGPEGAREAFGALLQGLIHNDFVADRQAQKDYGKAPEIHETTKKKALDALLASVPADYDTHKAKTDKKALNEASKRFGYGRVKNIDGKWKISGMRSPLYHHQLIGVDWMLTRELSVDKPYGGLLADSMGLGKTLQILAAMVGNPPSKEEAKSRIKATLIVLPSSAIRQWQLEIATHVDPNIFPRVLHYKAKKEIPIISLRDFDIVLTSYHEVMSSFPFNAFEDAQSSDTYEGVEKWFEDSKEATGDLHKIHWYRIVLDEAHAIKNCKSRTSIACQSLRGKYRWALSGTPLQNSLSELFPYLRFLDAPWTKSYSEFCDHFCDPDAEDAMARISVILAIVMRRTLKDKMLGRPIVELPPIHPDTHYISFSSEERVLYRILEESFRDIFNRHLREGTAEKNYAMFIVQLLRLRQCTAHPFLLESTVKEFLNVEDILRLKSEWKRLSGCKQPLYEQISQWMQRTEDERLAMKARGEPTLGPGERQPFGVSDFGKCFRMAKELESLNYKTLKQRVVCRLCGDLPTDALLTDCHHAFCRNCLENYLADETQREGVTTYDQCPEPKCRKIFTKATPYGDLNLPDDETYTDETESEADDRSSKNWRKGNARSKKSKAQSLWYKACIESEDEYLPPSAKTVALKAQILKWIDEAPNDKIIVFTQWRLMAKIIGKICEMEKWEFVHFNGDMNLNERHASVVKFHEDPEIKIMVAGLKCGGQALNLTCANRIISIDLWWNHSVEQQAFGRIFRIGQHKETYVTRLVIKNSIDCRLLKLQAYKLESIDRAMQDTGESIVEPLSIRDLASLFGHLRENDDGTLVVEADYETEDEANDYPESESPEEF